MNDHLQCRATDTNSKPAKGVLIAIAIVSGFCTVGFSFFVWWLYQQGLRAAEYGALSSMVACATSQQPNIKVQDPSGILSDAEYLSLMSVFRTCDLDRGRSYWNEDGLFVDRWGKRYGVKVYVTKEGRQSFEMWSESVDCRVGPFH